MDRVHCPACRQTGHTLLECPNRDLNPRNRQLHLNSSTAQISGILPHHHTKGSVQEHLQPSLQIRRLEKDLSGLRANSTKQDRTPILNKAHHPKHSQTDQGAHPTLPENSRQTKEGSRPTRQGPTNSPHNSKQTRHDGNPIQSQGPVEVATGYWRRCVRGWYPNLQRQTYFLPPLHFNRVPYDVQSVADQAVLVRTPCDRVICNSVPNIHPPQSNPPPLASRVWPGHVVCPGDPIPRIQDTDVIDDRAMQEVLHNIQELAEKMKEVMVVISQLDFRNYLDAPDDPESTEAVNLLQRPDKLGICFGNFDLLIIHRKYGLIVGEVKAVGADPLYSTDQAVVTRVKKAVKQLNKADFVLRHLVSDLAPVNLTKILMLPNVTSAQLQQALDTNPDVGMCFSNCVGTSDTAAAVARCLCADNLRTRSSEWWKQAVTDDGPDAIISDDIYETLVARFCGPATTVVVPTITTSQRVVELRTPADAIAHTGLLMSVLTLYPEQVDLLNRPELERVFLWGPPGTGKTVVLTLKGIQWRERGKSVHLLSLNKDSRAVVMLIESQLKHTLKTSATTTATATPPVLRHVYDFESSGETDRAVLELKRCADNGELYVIVDEAFSACSDGAQGSFAEFVTRLSEKVPKLHLWAASVRRKTIPNCLKQERLTTPIRCPPAVCRQVEQSTIIDDRLVLKYGSSAIPAPTDGPAVRRLHHSTHDRATGQPENCDRCGNELVDLISELLKGQCGHDLQYRDTIILVDDPRDNLPVVRCLRARGVPMKLVKSSGSIHAIRELALAEKDSVTVTHHSVVAGLERRVVAVMGQNDNTSRLYAMSRSTSLLVLCD